jgi:hypothetical protein
LQKRQILFLYKSILCFSFILSLFFINDLRNFEKLKYLNTQAIKKRGDYELNVLLYNFLTVDDKIKTVYVVRDFNNLNLLPEMSHKFINLSCFDFEKSHKENIIKSYYILTDKRETNSIKEKIFCKKNFFEIIENINEKMNIKKIFEYKNYTLYLREYK